MTKTVRNFPELLAPAGNLLCAITAFENGADAVYAGMGRFNAREMGDNFSRDDMSRLSNYCKKTGKRFYLTLNTLVKETEWEDLGSLVESAAALAPDALIIQDIGVAEFLRRYYPDLEVHGSTQMGIHNSAGVAAGAALGLSRIILERQLPLEELRSIRGSAPVEIEVFIHGALCCGLSGHCLFSSWIGGWSGNRGRCKQPCRRRYHGMEQGVKKSGFFFSTQDLYTLDLLPELVEAGVASFKIEGRLKKPDYVKQVVTAYRMVLDRIAEEGPQGLDQGIMGEARQVLAGSYGRRWSHGWYRPEETPLLIQYDNLGVSGKRTGRVSAVKPQGVVIELSGRLHIGDRLRIQPPSGSEGPGVTVTKMFRNRESVKKAVRGDTVYIPIRKEVPADGLVYKTGESIKETERDLSSLPLYNPPRLVDLDINVTRKHISVELPGNPGDDGRSITWSRQWALEAAEKHGASAETVQEAFRATRRPELAAGKIQVQVEEGLFLPASLLKKTRRAFWDDTAPLIESREAPPREEPEAWRAILRPSDRPSVREALVTEALPASASPDAPDIRRSLSLQRNTLPDGLSAEDEIALPFFCPEGELTALKGVLSRALERGVRRIRITSLYQLELIKELLRGRNSQGSPDALELTASYPLPVCNSLTAEALARMGVSRVQGWLEMEGGALKLLSQQSPLPVEIYTEGHPFLLATRAPVAIDGVISDGRGRRFIVVKREAEGLTYIYPVERMFLSAAQLREAGLQANSCYRDKRPLPSAGEEPAETAFNFEHSLI